MFIDSNATIRERTALSSEQHESASLAAPITRRSRIRITPYGHTFDGTAIHAINWFDTRSLWLYNVYNRLAAVSVARIGGQPLFKARLVEVLQGDVSDRRETLLLVRYPGVRQFASMLSDRRFQLTSVLRELAVSRFSFGLSEATQQSLSPWGVEDNKQYLIHHWRCTATDQQPTFDALRSLLAAADCQWEFAASVRFHLVHEKDTGSDDEIPCLMDHVLIASHDQKQALRDCIAKPEYQRVIDQCSSSFIGLMRRIDGEYTA